MDSLKETLKILLFLTKEVEERKARVRNEAIRLLGVEELIYQMPDANQEDVNKMREDVLKSLGVEELDEVRTGGKVIRMRGPKLILYMSTDVPPEVIPKFPGVKVMDVTHYPLADVDLVKSMDPDVIVIVRLDEGPCELESRSLKVEVPEDKVKANELISKSMTGSRDPEDLATALAVLTGLKEFKIVDGKWEDDEECGKALEDLLRGVLRS